MITPEEFYLEDLKSKFEKINPSDYYLSYSGGRDSHFLYWFIKEYLKEPRIEIVSINTYMEIPEIRNRMSNYSDRMLIPIMKPFDIKRDYGIPCQTKMQDGMVYQYRRAVQEGRTLPKYMREYVLHEWNERQIKYGGSKFAINNKLHDALLNGTLHNISPLCCKYLKKLPARTYEKEYNKKPILGIMANESLMRKKNNTSCFDKKGWFRPIWDLTDELRESIEKIYDIEVPNIYKYVNQTGCAGCPYGLRGGLYK